MGFFDRIFGSNKKVYEDKRDPKMVCELSIEGEKYLLDSFEVEVNKDDGNRYVKLYATFGEKIAPKLEAWIMRSSVQKDGVVKFYENESSPKQGSAADIAFKGATCIRLRKENSRERSQTTLVMISKNVIFGQQEYEAG